MSRMKDSVDSYAWHRHLSLGVCDTDDELVTPEWVLPPTTEIFGTVHLTAREGLAWSHERMTLDRAVQRRAIDREIEMSFHERKLKRHAPFQARRERGQ